MDLEQAWRDHGKEIYTYVYYRVHNRQDAEDVTQETFLRLLRSQSRSEGIHGSIIGLLKTTARNLLIDRWRQRRGSRLLPLEPELAAASEEPGPEQLTERKDEVNRALMMLGEESRLVVQYRLLEGYSVKETAELLGKSESAVKTMQFRAIQTIRNALMDEAGSLSTSGGTRE